jgi:DnaJ-class molecular chaperone
MSKKFHPDINDTPEATAKFQAGADAYAVLADDRQR